MKKYLKMTYSTILLIFSLLLLVSITIAWFVMTNEPKAGDISLITNDEIAYITVDIKVNDGLYQTVSTKEEFQSIFGNAKPSDMFSFRLTLKNRSSANITSNLRIRNIKDSILMNYFYINNGNVNINLYDEYQQLINSDLITLQSSKDDLLEYDNYAINYLINLNNNIRSINLFENYMIVDQGYLIVEFVLIYDEISTIQGKIFDFGYIEVT